jgi:hypothetical protein
MSDVLVLSHSRVKTWRRCPNQYRYKYVERLRPKKKSVQLERGSWVHELLMLYYDGEDWKGRHRELTKQFNNLFEEEREHLGDLPRECLRIMRSYIRYYSQDLLNYRVIDSEMNEEVTLPNGQKYVVVIDLIMEDLRTGLLWPWDHKTRKSFQDRRIMLMDPQLTLYFDALQVMGYEPLGGAVVNEISTKPPAIPEVLKSGALSKRKNIDTNVYTYMAEIRRHGLDPANYADILAIVAARQKDRFFRRTEIARDRPVLRAMRRESRHSSREIRLAAKYDSYPRTVDNSCQWMCDYRDICFAELHGGDISTMVKLNFNKKEPND